ncbi:hypothetical protein EV190_104141 [Actinorugispora endophytica]|uniref:DUF5753 domain-containing protein n=2 Tax=Actinorugispora endophytica TaxID=1605990 RepID=A0A4R6V0M5_9ACTN|nr:hypothetical protein EV190_104141 [Actinorugispora endophytica]
MSNGFVLLDYENPEQDPSLVSLEGRGSSTFLEEPHQVEAFREAFGSIQRSALSETAAIRLIEQLREETTK